MREKLLEDSTLTFKKAVDICRAYESSQQQLHEMSKETTVDRLKGAPNAMQKGQHPKTQWKRPSRNLGERSQKCTRCGRDQHGRESCPAAKAECRKCLKKGHYAVCCFSKPISQASVKEVKDEAYLGAVSNAGTDAWHVDVQLEQSNIQFKMDTGADVTVMPAVMVPKNKYPLERPSKRLFGPGKIPLKVLGQFTSKMKVKNAMSIQDIYVVEDLEEPLLGRPAIQALGLVKRVETVKEGDKERIQKTFPRLFSGLGKMKETYTIRLKDSAVPYAVTAPRRVPLPFQQKVEEELRRLQDQEVIRPVNTPTDWCAPIVVVPKAHNDAVRICVDLTRLNESVKRENYPLPSTDQLLAQLEEATVFTKLDCNSGFYQVPLEKSSQELTTFITPIGRFCFQCLLFGISSGSEVFHRIMTQLLSDIPGVICDIDDVLVYGRNQVEHDQRLKQVLEKLQDAGVTLNDKCAFGQTSIKFLGHVISKDGVQMDPDKVEAIRNMPRPKSVPELRRVLGLVNFVRKFSPNLAEETRPLRDLLKKEIQWTWGDAQERAFQRLKEQLTSPPVLAHYSTSLPTKVSADASSYGLGAVLLQERDGEWQPVFFASRSMTSTEQRYAQVEKEALASTWACEKFADFLIGLPSFTIETDHRPLLALLKSKQLDELSPLIQRFRMRLMRYRYDVIYTAGKDLTTADALSRAPVGSPQTSDLQLDSDVAAYVKSVVEGFPASKQRMDEIRAKQQKDIICCKVKDYCNKGWPDVNKVEPDLKPFHTVRDDLTVQQGLLLFRDRLVIPEVMRQDILSKIHGGHQGIVKCRALARSSVWWSGLSTDIKVMIEECATCVKERKPPPEPLQPTPVPDYPWQKVGVDLMDWRGNDYLVVVDYFSRYIEMALLRSTTSETVIQHLKSIMSRHGIPEVMMTDNGPQFDADKFSRFGEEYGFIHETSSPRYPQANGEAERAVQTLKQLLLKAEDPYVAMLNYRATSLQCGFSPAERLMGRRLRTKVPAVPNLLIPDWPKFHDMRSADVQQKEAQKKNHDKRHRAQPLPTLKPGERVWLKTPTEKEAVILRPVAPRSYELQTKTGIQRRNRRHLNRRLSDAPTPKQSPDKASTTIPTDAGRPGHRGEDGGFPDPSSEQRETDSPSEGLPKERPVTTRSGRVVKRPNILDL
ncbi:hypothetical protein V1264_017754 [Littorina saxatilis]|uniref:Endonuclease n=1 Tax=Littorina saxatilis TaxID=31220 RepID=A0AAN9GG28_9CAEN